MRVGYSLLTLFPGRVGGSETYVRGLLGAFCDGYGPEDVTVLANRHVLGPYSQFARGPVSMCHVASYRPGDSVATRLLAMMYAWARPHATASDVPAGLDVIHYPGTVPIPRPRGPHVVTIHDVQHHDLPEFFSRGERRFRAMAYDAAARQASLVVTPSHATKERLMAAVGVPGSRIEVVPYGVDHDRFQPAPRPEEDRLLDALGLPERFVFYPANIWPHKNHERLLEGLALVGDRGLSLVLSGLTYQRGEHLAARSAELGVEDRVHHIGHVPAPAMAAMYRRARALVFPSLYEGFGFPPLEAMACGCAVASSMRASLKELCGGVAVELDPEEPASIAAAIEQVASDETLRERLRSAGLERARRARWGVAAQRHRELYERVAGAASK